MSPPLITDAQLGILMRVMIDPALPLRLPEYGLITIAPPDDPRDVEALVAKGLMVCEGYTASLTDDGRAHIRELLREYRPGRW